LASRRVSRLKTPREETDLKDYSWKGGREKNFNGIRNTGEGPSFGGETPMRGKGKERRTSGMHEELMRKRNVLLPNRKGRTIR